ncbi:phage terminase large subunit-like protein [Methylobacterium sp. BE186]|uniref:terminase large subunit n=1 Tax=Methylobacterium sp. BE186 TaxID=2817715 RepID=UPI002857B29D|nr:terminase TerL endonuclease subunit [Methylobacterium sp. BE186]MDR7040563.1 phage terminase large subunit-like protein [Methylobacterium sp. BE186]
MTAWSCTCRDWQARIRSGRSLIPDLPLVRSEADRGVAIFNRLRLPDVAGKPEMRIAAGDWMRDLVGALFGSYDPEAKVRHLREFFVLVPKKNSKTTGGAAIMVTAMLVNRRPRAEFLIVAPTQEVADLAFRQAVGMIEADPVLALKFHVQEHLKKITYRPTGAFLKVKSFDPKIVVGSKPTGVLLDELHVIAEAKDADRVIGQLRGGMISQPEAFLLTITTQSERPPSGVFRAELQKARAVRDGVLTTAPLLPVLYEMPADADWKDRANWSMVTPNAGKSITVERLIPDFQAAEQAGEQELRRWATQHLNVEIGLALRSDRWAGAEFWQGRVEAGLTLDSLIERSEVVCIGIDGGGLDDLFGLCALGREKGTRDWLAWTHAWCHAGVLERRKSIASQLRDFEVAGELTIVADELGDIAAIIEIVEQVKDAGLLACVGVDPAGLGEFIEALAEIEVTQEDKLVVGVPQGYGMMNAIKTAERKLANGTLRHSGSGLMAWAVSNLKIEPTATAIRATKQNAGDAKIDPAMALFDAVVPMSLNPEPARAPEYQLIFV